MSESSGEEVGFYTRRSRRFSKKNKKQEKKTKQLQPDLFVLSV